MEGFFMLNWRHTLINHMVAVVVVVEVFVARVVDRVSGKETIMHF